MLSAGLLALASSACAHQAEPGMTTASQADNHKINVAQGVERVEIVIAPDEAALDYETSRVIDRFAARYVRQGHGAILLSTPSGGDNVDAAARIAQTVRLQLADAGVPFGAIAGGTYDASGGKSPPLILSFSLYQAIAPECAPLYTQDLGHNTDNRPWASFGCTAQANLAAMIVDPADLKGPREESPRDAARRAVVLDRYRNGETTHADRSDDERVQVSTTAAR
jgi:pilus assembly protein CpaD